MKQLPYSVIETAVNALQFCIVTRARTDTSRGQVICCPPPISVNQYTVSKMALTFFALYNDVIDDAFVTSVSIARARERFWVDYPPVESASFGHTAQQYTVALQNLFSAIPTLTSDGKE